MMLPERHFSPEAKDVIKPGLGLIMTMNALVLSLMISTAKSSYDPKRALVAQIAADTILADRSLTLHGSETKEAPNAPHDLVTSLIEQLQSLHGELPKNQSSEVKADPADLYQMVGKLSPADGEQKALKAEVLRISLEVAQIRAAALIQQANSIPVLFLWF